MDWRLWMLWVSIQLQQQNIIPIYCKFKSMTHWLPIWQKNSEVSPAARTSWCSQACSNPLARRAPPPRCMSKPPPLQIGSKPTKLELKKLKNMGKHIFYNFNFCTLYMIEYAIWITKYRVILDMRLHTLRHRQTSAIELSSGQPSKTTHCEAGRRAFSKEAKFGLFFFGQLTGTKTEKQCTFFQKKTGLSPNFCWNFLAFQLDFGQPHWEGWQIVIPVQGFNLETTPWVNLYFGKDPKQQIVFWSKPKRINNNQY